MILAYFQNSRGPEVASKSSVLSVAYHKFQSWSLRKDLFCVVCHASAYKRNLCHVLNCCSHFNTVPQLKPKLHNAETNKSFHEFSFINKAGAALMRTITSCHTKAGNRIRTRYSLTQRDYLILILD